MKKVEVMMVDEATPDIPIAEQRFVKIDELGDRIQIHAFDGNVGTDFLWRFKTNDYGVCYGETNPLTAVQVGYFQIKVPQADKPFRGYCTNERVIATLKSVIEGKRAGKNALFGEFMLLDDAETAKVYEEFKIPRFTLI